MIIPVPDEEATRKLLHEYQKSQSEKLDEILEEQKREKIATKKEIQNLQKMNSELSQKVICKCEKFKIADNLALEEEKKESKPDLSTQNSSGSLISAQALQEILVSINTQNRLENQEMLRQVNAENQATIQTIMDTHTRENQRMYDSFQKVLAQNEKKFDKLAQQVRGSG